MKTTRVILRSAEGSRFTSGSTTLPVSSEKRPRKVSAIARGAGHDADGVRTLALGERALDGALQPGRAGEVVLDEVGEHFRVRLGLEGVALAAQPLLDLEVVLEDPVVDDDERARAVRVGMRVLVGRTAVRGPARVTDADVAGHRTLAQDALERLDAPGRAPHLKLAGRAQHRDARGVVPAILQPLE